MAGLFVTMLLVLGVWLAFVDASAFGAATRSLIGTFGSFAKPRGIAVDQSSGDVYVADTANNRVEKFSAVGAFIFAVGKEVNTTTHGDLCIAGEECGPGAESTAPGEFSQPYFVAMDNSGGPSAGDFYVADGFDGLVSKFDSSGHLVTGWGSLGQLNGSTATDGPFGASAGIAVDSTGNLLVLNAGCPGFLFKFAQDGTFVEDFETPRCSSAGGLGVNAAGDLFKQNGEDDSIEEMTSKGEDIGQLTQTGAPGFTVDPATGDVYAMTFSATVAHYAFNGSGEVVEPFGGTCVVAPLSGGCGATDTVSIAQTSFAAGVDSESGNLYVAGFENGTGYIYGPAKTLPDVATGAASAVAPTSATLNGEVDPDGVQVNDCHFDYGTTTFYGHTVACGESVGAGTAAVAVHADLSGLQAGVTFHFRLEASNENGTSFGGDATFSTPPPPSIDSASATHVTASSADLNAEINPNGFDTTYRFEWGTSTAYGTRAPVPDGDIGAGTSDVTVSTHLAGLSANTTYHWRVVANNVNGTTVGGDHTFVYGTGGGGLPDGRAYEMVTPMDKNAAQVGAGVFIFPANVSEDGSRVVVHSIQCFDGAQSCTADRQNEGEPYLFSRTSSGWVTSALAPPATQLGSPTDVVALADTGMALFSASTPPAGEDDFWVRRADGSLADIGPASPPLEGAKGFPFPGPGASGFTPDFSHLVYELGSELDEYIGVGNSQPLLVGVSGGAGSRDLISVCGTELGSAVGIGGHSVAPVSVDGRTVFFTALKCGSGSGANAGRAVPADELYARIDESQTVLISDRSPSDCSGACASSAPEAASFVGASNDGSRAFFTDPQQLTNTAVQGAGNLYEYDFANPAGHNLIDVSAGDTSGVGPGVEGVMAVSADGSHVYFVSSGVLSEAPNAQGQTAAAGANNLYVFERDASHPAGHMAFIASLSAFDANQWFEGVGEANVTPDGRFLVFTSHARLTEDDVSGTGAAQVFRYDAESGQLTRVSIGENGFDDNGNAGSASLCAGQTLECTANAHIVKADRGFYRHDPSMSHDGSFVFFMSPAGLTPRALDYVQIGTSVGTPTYAQNVYEYHDGHVYLISDGGDTATQGNSGAAAVKLLGSDASGANVFFTTVDSLVPQDTDTQLDIYDARICTAGSPCITAPSTTAACEGEACQGSPGVLPQAPVAASVSFSGEGNRSSGAVAPEVRVLHRTVRGSRFVLLVRVPGAGRIAVSGAGVKAVSRSVGRGGVYRLLLRLTARQRRRLGHRHRLRLRLRVSFAPAAGGAPSVAAVTIIVKR